MKALADLLLSLSGRDRAPRAAMTPRQARYEDSAKPAPDCPIWNDIARALDSKPRGAK